MFRTLYDDAQGIMNRPISPLPSTYIKYRKDEQKWVVLDSFDQLSEPEYNSFDLRGDEVHSYHDHYDPDDWKLAYPVEPPPCWLPWY